MFQRLDSRFSILLLGVFNIVDERPILMLYEVQSESTVKRLGDEPLGDSVTVAAELTHSHVELFNPIRNLFAPNMMIRLNGIVQRMPYGSP